MNLIWEDIDFKEEVIHLRTSKNGEPRIIPLRGYALTLLIDLKNNSRNSSGKLFLFPAPNDPSKPYDIRSAWEAALQRASIQDFHFHDLRHATATTLRKLGKDLLYELSSREPLIESTLT